MAKKMVPLYIDGWAIPYERICSGCKKEIRTHRQGFKRQWEEKLSLTMTCSAQEYWEGHQCRECKNGKNGKNGKKTVLPEKVRKPQESLLPPIDPLEPLGEEKDEIHSVDEVIGVMAQFGGIKEPRSRSRKDMTYGKQVACLLQVNDEEHRVIIHVPDNRGIPVSLTSRCIEIWDLTAKICLREASDCDAIMIEDPIYRKGAMDQWKDIDRVYDVDEVNQLLQFFLIGEG